MNRRLKNMFCKPFLYHFYLYSFEISSLCKMETQYTDFYKIIKNKKKTSKNLFIGTKIDVTFTLLCQSVFACLNILASEFLSYFHIFIFCMNYYKLQMLG